MKPPINKSELWPDKGPCYLCGTVGPLCRSHIIPKFVGDWLRRTGVTGRFRSSKAPSRLVEDLDWRYILCLECEGRFNKFETEVCESIFLPIHEGKQDRFRYGQSFALFVASVVWRALVVLRREGGLAHFDEIPGSVDAAERAWRSFLLGDSRTPAPHVLHALPMDVPTNLEAEGRSPFFGRFLLRAPAVGTRCRRGCGYVIVKMARLILFGVIAPGDERREWKATQIHVSGGGWGVEEYHVPGWFMGYLNRGAEKLQKAVEGLSDTQKGVTEARIWEEIDENVDRVAESGTFRAFEADLEVFGRDAFGQPSPDDKPRE